MCKRYLQLAYEHLENKGLCFDEFWGAQRLSFVRDVEKACLLKHFQAAIWTVNVLEDASISEVNAWQWKYLKARVDMIAHLRAEFNI